LVDDAVTGDKIEDGAVELSVATRARPPTAIEPASSGQAVAECNGGEVVVGVGFESGIGFQPNTSEPDGNLWVVEERETREYRVSSDCNCFMWTNNILVYNNLSSFPSVFIQFSKT
jgi:hypothetical protein